ncbi:MAG: hypothetical protein J7L14_01220 [Candidatus Diapherotrites archaeon]|nr:hypothetical protein [Candidatus Diapherotrites archaeon]
MLELKDSEFFRKAISAISAFISEGNFRFNEKGLFFKAIDPSQIVLIDLFVPAKSFSKYSMEPSFIGLNVQELAKIMERIQPNEIVQMKLTESEFKIKAKGEIERNFSLPLIDVTETEINIPKQEFVVSAKLDAQSFKEALKDAKLFSSSIIFKAKNNALVLVSSSTKGKTKTIFSEGINCNAQATAKYSLNFLQNIIREAEDDVKIEFSNDAPLRVSYSIGPANFVFYLAHMIL